MGNIIELYRKEFKKDRKPHTENEFGDKIIAYAQKDQDGTDSKVFMLTKIEAKDIYKWVNIRDGLCPQQPNYVDPKEALEDALINNQVFEFESLIEAFEYLTPWYFDLLEKESKSER